LLKPFQMLVQNYATPAYGTIDPTPLVAVTYLCMFGLMFGDAGHGLVLMIGGLLGLTLGRGLSDGVRNLFKLISWCGGAAVLAGVLFGSYFGFSLVPALWFDYHGAVVGHAHEGSLVSNIFGILAITLYFGIGVISLGLVLNWINLVVTRRWLDLFLSKGGLLGAWMYGAGVYVGAVFARSGYRELPPAGLLFWILGVPALLLALGPPLHSLGHHGKSRRFGFFTLVDWFMEWIVELLEIASGYLANTLSFMRVAGLGVAHVSLMIAFTRIAGLLAGPSGWSVWSVLVYVSGNTLVILLEGLSAGIQSLRLNYYEFFSKYFTSSGRTYAPVTLRRAE
jgi:V/A-type H+-transporting ATPase subunit I